MSCVKIQVTATDGGYTVAMEYSAAGDARGRFEPRSGGGACCADHGLLRGSKLVPRFLKQCDRAPVGGPPRRGVRHTITERW